MLGSVAKWRSRARGARQHEWAANRVAAPRTPGLNGSVPVGVIVSRAMELAFVCQIAVHDGEFVYGIEIPRTGRGREPSASLRT
jgi:hypothetical protein